VPNCRVQKKSAKRDREFIIAEGRKSARSGFVSRAEYYTPPCQLRRYKRGGGWGGKNIKVNETALAILLCGNMTCRRKQLPDQYAIYIPDNILLCCTETVCNSCLQ
jgi:hypothetical protein